MTTIKINKENTETTGIAIRDVKTEFWKAFKAIAVLSGKNHAEVLEMLVEEHLENPSNE